MIALGVIQPREPATAAREAELHAVVETAVILTMRMHAKGEEVGSLLHPLKRAEPPDAE